jgi:hypothetical protein
MPEKPGFNRRIRDLILLRAIVAALGERVAPPWWRTQFLTDVGLRALGRVFARTSICAAFRSTSVAARADHDKRIGIGRRYHLFRFPVHLEQGTAALIKDDPFCSEVTALLKAPQDVLLQALAVTAKSHKVVAAEGPIRIGPAERLLEPSALEAIASHYRTSIETGRRVFPYFEGNEE